MRIQFYILCLLVSTVSLLGDTEQSVTISPTQTESYQKDGKTIIERTAQIHERIAISGPQMFKAAIFIADRVPELQDKMEAFDDLVTARVTDLGFQVLSKEIISDSLRKFDPELATTRRPADSLDSKLSEESSALRLAQGLGADYLLVGSLTSLGTRQRALDVYGVKRVTEETTLRITYKVIDGQTGATVAANADKVAYEAAQSENSVEKSDDVTNQLMDEAAKKIADSLQLHIAQNHIPAPSAAPAMVSIAIELEAADLYVPDVRIDDEHTIQISESRYKVHPLNATVEIDGVAVGSAPGKIELKPGFSRLRITREGFKPWERTINAVNGQILTVALEASDEGYARWKDSTAFINNLKNGAKVTDAQAELLLGQAKMFSQSGFKVDTKNAPATNIFNR